MSDEEKEKPWPRCGACKWYGEETPKRSLTYPAGLCRINPPVQHGVNLNGFPIVARDTDWCGMFDPTREFIQ